METVLPKRKSHHLQGYDYSQNGAYFITICTHQRRMLFGPNRAPVGAESISARMAARVFREIIGQYPAAQCRYFVVMPNHFHALVEIERARADLESAPTEGIGRKGNNNEVPRASNARPYIVLQFIKTKTPPALAGKRCLFIKLSD